MTYIVYNTDTREVSSYHVEESSALNNCPTGFAVESVAVDDMLSQPPSLFVDGALVEDAARVEKDLKNQTRFERTQLLLEVDAYVANPLRWAGFTSEKQAEWSTYRQELLDVPQQAGFPANVTWPTKP